LNTATDMTTKQNGSGHQETEAANGKKADHPTDIDPATSFGLGPAETTPSSDEEVVLTSLKDTTVHSADRLTTVGEHVNL